jgi:hypothetical protein
MERTVDIKVGVYVVINRVKVFMGKWVDIVLKVTLKDEDGVSEGDKYGFRNNR